MIREDRFLISRKPYAVDLDSLSGSRRDTLDPRPHARTTSSEGKLVSTDAIRDALASDGRFARHIANIKISERRRTLGMSMQPGDAGITLQVPVGTTPVEVISLLAANWRRVAGMVLKARQNAPDHPVKRLVGGEGYLWLGRSSRLRVVDDATVPLERIHTGHGYWMHLSRNAVHLGARQFIDWYIREGTAWITPEAAQLWASMTARQPLPAVRVDDIGRTRWGVYDGATHSIRIAWQALQLQPRLVRHVLGHELTHATHPGGRPHGPEFWRAFERAMPGARKDHRQLTEEGRSLWMGDAAQGHP